MLWSTARAAKAPSTIITIIIITIISTIVIFIIPIGSMYAIYGNIDHQYTPNVGIYTIHGSYGIVIVIIPIISILLFLFLLSLCIHMIDLLKPKFQLHRLTDACFVVRRLP